MERKEAIKQIIEAARVYKPWHDDFRVQLEYILEACKTEVRVEIPVMHGTCADKVLSDLSLSLDWLASSKHRIQEKHKEIKEQLYKIPKETDSLPLKQKRDKLKAEEQKMYEFIAFYDMIIKNSYFLIKYYAKEQKLKGN